MELKRHEGESLQYLTMEPDGFVATESYPMVILLHGYGSHMGDLVGLAHVIGTEGYLYAFPNAPMPIQLGYGASGYAWAEHGEGPVGTTAAASSQDAAQQSEQKLNTFFTEIRGLYLVPPGQIILGGFSQGAMMSFRVGLPQPDRFRGLVALSGRVQDPATLRPRLPQSRSQAIFVAHGTRDQMISVDDARRSQRFLEAEGYGPEYHEYEMGHEISQEVMDDLLPWLSHVLPPRGVPR